MATPKKRKSIDWDKGDKLIRAGLLSFREIGRILDCDEGAVRKRKKTKNIDRDVTGEVRKSARSKLVRSAEDKTDEKSAPTDEEVIEEAATLQANIVRSHRQTIKNRRNFIDKLHAELEMLTDGQADIKKLIKGLKSKDERVLRDTINKLTSLPTRIKGVADLVKAEDSLIKMERKAFSIDEPESDREGKKDDLSDIERAARVAAILDNGRTRRAGQPD